MDTNVKVTPCFFFGGRWIPADTIVGVRRELEQAKQKNMLGKTCYGICLQVKDWNRWICEWWSDRDKCDERWVNISKIMPVLEVFKREAGEH